MEQLKPFIEGVKANRFWIFCGATLIACVVVYYMVGSSLAKEEATATGKIKQTIGTAKSLRNAGVAVNPEAEKGQSQTAHPNDDTLKEMEKVVKAAAAATKEAWTKKHQLQLDSQLFDKATIREMQANFQKYLPAESVPFTEADDETMLPETVRVNYRDRIRDELPKLAKLVRSYWKPNYGKSDPQPSEVIIWNDDNQEYWNARFTQFVSDWNFQAAESNVPRTLQVLYTTEDLWLLRSILRDVIGKTVFDKGEIYANDLSVIKRIDHILIGKDAEMGAQGLPGQGGGMNESPGRSGMAAMSGKGRSKKKADSTLDPINGRYVDNQGKDIPAKDYRAIYKNKGATDKKKTHWKIAKRVKVRIGLQMDTREIQNLQANCANATFPIEIRSLRVNKHKPSKLKNPGTGGAKGGGGGFGSSKGMGGDVEDRSKDLMMSGGSGARPPGAGGSGATPGASGGASSSGGSGSSEADDQGYMKPVEIYGYIYIYNRVDNSIFKILDDKKTNP